MRYIIFTVLGFYFLLQDVHGQSDVAVSRISESFQQNQSRYVQEKLYVHTDKESYISREMIWFRIYEWNALSGRPLTLSQIAYVEVLDKNNLPVIQEKISLKPGETFGSFIIPVGLPSGTYQFRAYTSWMKNFAPEYYFMKPIRIINPRDLAEDRTAIGDEKYDLQFFPEGGNLVQQIRCRVAFRITDVHGKGLDGLGILMNSAGDTLLQFRPLHFGLGHFEFTPDSGQTYHSEIRLSNGKRIVKDLPPVYPEGYVMNVSKVREHEVLIQIHVSPEFDREDVYLFIHGTGSSLKPIKRQLTNSAAEFMIQAQDLEDGISQITLLDKNEKPVCERLYFKYPEKKLLIGTAVDAEYKPRSKIELTMATSNYSGQPVPADLSLSVYRLDSLQNTNADNIVCSYYLTSELGAIEFPAFYFSGGDESRENEMDNLMMTHGWRRYKWGNGFDQGAEKFEFAPEMHGHIIHGKLLNSAGLPSSRKTAYLSVPSGRTQFRSTLSDEMGNLKFEMPDFYGSGEIIVQTDPREDSSLHIDIASPFSSRFAHFTVPDFSIPGKNSATLRDQMINEQVLHVFDGPLINRFTTASVDTNSFYVTPDEKYLLDDYTRFLSMEEVMREYVHSANVILKKGRFELYLADNARHTFFSDSPLMLIDGVPFFDVNELFQQDPKKIRRLDLMNREYALGNRTYKGIVNMTTYQGDLNGILMSPQASVLDYPGISEQREFFSPVYETENEINSRVPDYRTLLFWSPQILTGNRGSQVIHFYTSDLPGHYAVVIQGIAENGQPGSQVSFFSIKK